MSLARASGVLLHPTSLPGPHGSGDFGAEAFHFVDWLAQAGQRLWQTLPLGGIGPGNSPYMSTSAFAGNVLLIDLDGLKAEGWLTEQEVIPDAGWRADRVDFPVVAGWRMERLQQAAKRFADGAGPQQRSEFQEFCLRQSSWLHDYALFMTLADAHGGALWSTWAPLLRSRDHGALLAAASQYTGGVLFWQFCQWCFDR
ncbi:MAG: 4-alpha-glucanotransferase, partial [Burkholderiaceae bacterium]